MEVEKEEKTYFELRNNLLMELGKKDEHGNIVKKNDGTVEFSTEEDRALFYEKNNELLDAEFEVKGVSFEELADHINITAAELVVLRDIIV